MVDSNLSLASEGRENEKLSRVEHISRAAAQENVTFLKTQADSWLAVLFNVFGAVSREDRGKIGDVVGAWASIAEPEVCSVLRRLLRVCRPFHSIFRKHSPKWHGCSSKT